MGIIRNAINEVREARKEVFPKPERLTTVSPDAAERADRTKLITSIAVMVGEGAIALGFALHEGGQGNFKGMAIALGSGAAAMIGTGVAIEVVHNHDKGSANQN